MGRKKNILVCPLDWGLGHATRMVPVINELKRQNANVILAADHGPYEFLQNYYPNTTLVRLTGYNPKYPANGSMAWTMIKSLPKMIIAAEKSKNHLRAIVGEYNIDAVISDNRYELSLNDKPSVFITHQLNIQTSGIQKILSPAIRAIVNNYLNNYTEIWVPDYSDRFLSGVLSRSHKSRNNLHYVGILSRFNGSKPVKIKKRDQLLVMLSGPEPQRSILENMVLEQAGKSDIPTIVLQGLPQKLVSETRKNITLLTHASDDKIVELIRSSKYLICRPGYSTLMDLSTIETKAAFIPTPGQTEQEYLSRKLYDEGVAYSMDQKSFDLEEIISKYEQYTGFHTKSNNEVLKSRITNLLNIC